MRTALKGLDRVNCYLNRAMMIAGGVALLALMVLASGNVVLRAFQLPLSGAYEIISFLGAFVTASALGYTQKRRDHIMVEIVTEKFPAAVVRFIDALADLIIAGFFAVVAWQMYVWGLTVGESGEVSETLKFAYHPFILGVAFGFAVMTFSSLVDIARSIFGREGG
jgi:TRAP-type C4-dicarboxylate transport system permease small subunit